MTTYKHVKTTLEALERSMFKTLRKKYPQIPASVPAGVANGYAQFFSCENVTQETPDDQDCIVICGVGINYSQGKPHATYPNIEPWLYTLRGNTWVEDYAPAMRRALDSNITTYLLNSAAWSKNGYASSPNLLRHWNPAMRNPYILIATNLSPFLTQKLWTKQSTTSSSQLLNLWNPNDHICDLRRELGNEIDLWVVHGKQAVWPLFDNKSCTGEFPNWMLTHNLSGLGMVNIGNFWKKPLIQSARPPIFPVCQTRYIPSAVLDYPVDE